jgi:hypothetical protein
LDPHELPIGYEPSSRSEHDKGSLVVVEVGIVVTVSFFKLKGEL